MKFTINRTVAVVAGAATVVAFGVSGAVAGSLVGSKQIRDGAVHTEDLHRGAVSGPKLSAEAVRPRHLAPQIGHRIARGVDAALDLPGLRQRVERLEDRVGALETAPASYVLYTGDGSESMPYVTVPVEPVVLKDFVPPTFKQVHVHGDGVFGANVIIGLDQNDNGRYDADDVAWHVGDPADQSAALGGDTFIEMDAAAADQFAVDPSRAPFGNGSAWWQAGNASYYGDLAGLQANPELADLTVVSMKIVVGGSGNWSDDAFEIYLH